jgi:hypothetical protein
VLKARLGQLVQLDVMVLEVKKVKRALVDIQVSAALMAYEEILVSRVLKENKVFQAFRDKKVALVLKGTMAQLELKVNKVILVKRVNAVLKEWLAKMALLEKEVLPVQLAQREKGVRSVKED